MLRVWISLLALAVASVWMTAVASAEEDAFAFEDAPADALGPANAWGDLVTGRAEVVDDMLVGTVQVSMLPEMQPGVAYVFVFSDGTYDRYVAGAMLPDLQYVHGRWSDRGPLSMETAAYGSYAIGPGGSVSAGMPLALLGNVTTIERPRGLVWDVKPGLLPAGVEPILLDEAEGEGTLALPGRSEESAPAQAATQAEGAVPAAAAEGAQEPAAKQVPAPAVGIAVLAIAAIVLGRRRSR